MIPYFFLGVRVQHEQAGLGVLLCSLVQRRICGAQGVLVTGIEGNEHSPVGRTVASVVVSREELLSTGILGQNCADQSVDLGGTRVLQSPDLFFQCRSLVVRRARGHEILEPTNAVPMQDCLDGLVLGDVLLVSESRE